jgi:hypothetical protein
MDSTSMLVVALGAALLFPMLAVFVYQRRQRRHDRAMGRRRTQKIKL